MRTEKKLTFFLSFFYITIILLFISILLKDNFNFENRAEEIPVEEIEIKPVVNYNEFGLVEDSLVSVADYVKRNETLSSILSKHNANSEIIKSLAGISSDVFDIRRIIAGRPYHIFTSNNLTNDLRYFVYELDPVNYVVMDFADSISIYPGQKEVTIRKQAISGIIKSSLYNSVMSNEVNPELVIKLSDIFAWQIDFHRIQKGDKFKVIFEEEFVGDKSVGIGKITGAYFNHEGEDFYAINFTQDSVRQFFDEEGNSLRKAFLKAPLEFSRISSRYTKRRFHPVQKRYKPHLGTDYAAPYGTPIRSVGEGIVVQASYTRGNGNFVKVKHNGTYTTQYLHMSKFASGVKAGVRVKQGQVIGYVGSTGLATGPHLCYRFWKNGKQVDPFKEKIPPSHPVKKEYLDLFEKKKEQIITELKQLEILEEKMASA